MPKFKIVEMVRETREIEADCAQDALDAYINEGHNGDVEIAVNERHVEDEYGKICDVQDS